MRTIYTSRVGYGGADRLDTTVKSGARLGRLLAPTWERVGGVKCHETRGRDHRWSKYIPLTHEQYIDGYYDLLRERYITDREAFSTLVRRKRLVICCYCASGTFCHRHLAVDILAKVAAARGLSFAHGGELAVR